MTKKSTHFYNLNLALDRQQYERLRRQSEDIAEIVSMMVDDGIEPSVIRRHVTMLYPNLWLEAQTIEQAARWVAYQNENA